jgi:hypothetical protein
VKTFAISLLAAAAGFILIAFLLRPPSLRTSRQRPQDIPVTVATDPKPIERRAETSELPVSPSTTAMSAAQSKKAPAPAAAGESRPGSTLDEPVTKADALPSANDKPSGKKQEPKLSATEKLTLTQTSTSDTSLRNADYPRTYISAISVDLASPMHAVRLTWSGPEATAQETGPFHSSPGRGLGNNDCDDPDESTRQDSNCTPKGEFKVQGFSDTMPSYSHCKFVTWFLVGRGIAMHSYMDVPDYPASHGCVRLGEHAAQLIHNNAKIGATEVTVGGHWTFAR